MRQTEDGRKLKWCTRKKTSCRFPMSGVLIQFLSLRTAIFFPLSASVPHITTTFRLEFFFFKHPCSSEFLLEIQSSATRYILCSSWFCCIVFWMFTIILLLPISASLGPMWVSFSEERWHFGPLWHHFSIRIIAASPKMMPDKCSSICVFEDYKLYTMVDLGPVNTAGKASYQG